MMVSVQSSISVYQGRQSLTLLEIHHRGSRRENRHEIREMNLSAGTKWEVRDRRRWGRKQAKMGSQAQGRERGDVLRVGATGTVRTCCTMSLDRMFWVLDSWEMGIARNFLSLNFLRLFCQLSSRPSPVGAILPTYSFVCPSGLQKFPSHSKSSTFHPTQRHGQSFWYYPHN